MPAVTFSCPECGKVLKSAEPLPAGKKIKCPTCAAVFPLPDRDDEELAAGVSTRPRPPAAVAPDGEDDDDKPRRKAGRAAVEEEDDEDRPRRKKKASAKRRSGGGRGLVIGAVAFVLLLFLVGGVVGAYFIWFAGVNGGSGNEDPLAFVPPQAEVFIGADFPALLNDPVLGSQVEKSLREQAKSGDFFETCKKETGLEFKELFAQALICTDLATFSESGAKGGMAGGGRAPGGMGQAPGVLAPPPGGIPPRPRGTTLILRPSRPFDQKKMARSFKDPVRKSAHGKSYYEVNDGELRTVFMPSDRTLVLSTLQAGDLDPLFISDGTTPSVSADAVALARGVDKSTIYVVISFEGTVRAKLDDALRQGKGNKGNPMQPVMEQVAKGKGIAFWGTLEGEQVKLGLNVLNADAAGATAMVQAAETAWGAQKIALALGVGILKLQMPKIGQLLSELADSVKFTADGTTARLTAALGRTTLADAIAEGQNLQQGGGLFGGFNPGLGGGPPGGGKPNPGVPRPGGKK